MYSCEAELPPWHRHRRGGLPVSEHRKRELKAINISDRLEGKTGEATTQSRAQFRAYAFVFGAWIASFQDVPLLRWDLRQSTRIA